MSSRVFLWFYFIVLYWIEKNGRGQFYQVLKILFQLVHGVRHTGRQTTHCTQSVTPDTHTHTHTQWERGSGWAQSTVFKSNLLLKIHLNSLITFSEKHYPWFVVVEGKFISDELDVQSLCPQLVDGCYSVNSRAEVTGKVREMLMSLYKSIKPSL